jgi:hypothetical protein
MSHLLSSSSPEGHIDINISSIGGRRGRAVHRHPSFTSVPGMLHTLYTYTLNLHSAYMCYIRICAYLYGYASNTCTHMFHTWTPMLHTCTYMLHTCKHILHTCAHIPPTCTHMLDTCTQMQICFTLVHADASYLYPHL